ncbi:hypothetical protein HN51_012979 [Arachis hypogaea]
MSSFSSCTHLVNPKPPQEEEKLIPSLHLSFELLNTRAMLALQSAFPDVEARKALPNESVVGVFCYKATTMSLLAEAVGAQKKSKASKTQEQE